MTRQSPVPARRAAPERPSGPVRRRAPRRSGSCPRGTRSEAGSKEPAPRRRRSAATTRSPAWPGHSGPRHSQYRRGNSVHGRHIRCGCRSGRNVHRPPCSRPPRTRHTPCGCRTARGAARSGRCSWCARRPRGPWACSPRRNRTIRAKSARRWHRPIRDSGFRIRAGPLRHRRCPAPRHRPPGSIRSPERAGGPQVRAPRGPAATRGGHRSSGRSRRGRGPAAPGFRDRNPQPAQRAARA